MQHKANVCTQKNAEKARDRPKDKVKQNLSVNAVDDVCMSYVDPQNGSSDGDHSVTGPGFWTVTARPTCVVT